MHTSIHGEPPLVIAPSLPTAIIPTKPWTTFPLILATLGSAIIGIASMATGSAGVGLISIGGACAWAALGIPRLRSSVKLERGQLEVVGHRAGTLPLRTVSDISLLKTTRLGYDVSVRASGVIKRVATGLPRNVADELVLAVQRSAASARGALHS
jgi:hypothetical protein